MLRCLNVKTPHVKMFKCLNVKMTKGFTIIELLVAVALFTLIIGATVGMFVAAIRTQAKVLATQKVLDETSYVMEYMSRTIRMAKKDVTGDCLYTAGNNYEGGTAYIKFLNYHDECHDFDTTMFPHRILENRYGEDIYLTSRNIIVNPDWLRLLGQSGLDAYQPRITLSLTIQKYPEEKPVIKIQTTISQRNLDLR